MCIQADNPDTVFPFYLRARCSEGVQVSHVFRPEKYVEVFQVTAKEKAIPFSVINLNRFDQEEVMDLVHDIEGNRLLELDYEDATVGIIFAEPDFVSDSMVEVPGIGRDVFYRYTVCVGDDLIVLDIRDGISDDGTPEIDMECRRVRLYLPVDDENEVTKEVTKEVKTEVTNENGKKKSVKGRKELVTLVDLFPLTL